MKKLYEPNNNIRKIMLCNLGRSNFELSKFQAAINDFNEALRIDEADVSALLFRAKAHFKLEEFEDCIIDCEEILRLKQLEEVQKLMSDAKLSAARAKRGRNCYAVLGVSPGTSKAELKKAYHKLILAYHTDKNLKATALEKKKLERKFQEAQNAYNIAMF